MTTYIYNVTIPYGISSPDETAVRKTADALPVAERTGDDFTLATPRLAYALTLLPRDDADRGVGAALLTQAHEQVLRSGNLLGATMFEVEMAKQAARTRDLYSAIETSRGIVDDIFDGGDMLTRGPATTVLVESLLSRATDADVQEAKR